MELRAGEAIDIAPRPAHRRRLVLGLVAVQVADAAFNAVAKEWVEDDLEHLRLPQNLRFAFPVIKSGSAVGLLAGLRWPRLGRFTALALIAYFITAMGFHARAKDGPVRYLPAGGMLAWSIVALRGYTRR
jgi:hypothetical protein